MLCVAGNIVVEDASKAKGWTQRDGGGGGIAVDAPDEFVAIEINET